MSFRLVKNKEPLSKNTYLGASNILPIRICISILFFPFYLTHLVFFIFNQLKPLLKSYSHWIYRLISLLLLTAAILISKYHPFTQDFIHTLTSHPIFIFSVVHMCVKLFIFYLSLNICFMRIWTLFLSHSIQLYWH